MPPPARCTKAISPPRADSTMQTCVKPRRAVVLREKTRSPGRGFLAQGATVSGEAADVTDAILAGMPRELGQIDALARVDGADEARAIIVRAGRNPSHRIEPHRGVGALRSRAPSMDASSRRSIEQASWSCGAEGGILDRLPGLLAAGPAQPRPGLRPPPREYVPAQGTLA